MKKLLITLCSLALALPSAHLNAAPLGTAFTYQGRLTDAGNPANGRYDLECAIFDDASAGTQIGGGVTNLGVTVSNGLFTVSVDFGANVFTGDARWLGIGVRSNGLAGNFTPLNPRQPLTPSPYALYAPTAGTVTNGAIQSGKLGTTGPAPAAGQILGYDGSSLFWQTPGGANLWSLNGSSAYYNAGNVGIGTTAPAQLLQVGDHATLPGSQGMIRLASRSSDTGANRYWDFGVPTTAGDPGGPYYSFVIDDPQTGSGPEFMIRWDTGNVGIGTTNPGAKLQVRQVGNSGVGVFAGDRTPFGAALFETDVNTPGTHAWFAENGQRVFSLEAGGIGYFKGDVAVGSDLNVNGSTTIAGACFAQGNVEVGNSAFSASGLNEFTVQGIFDLGSGLTQTRLVVKQNGNVGIGKATPQAKLDVNGDARVSVLTITGGSDVAEPFQMSTQEIPKGAVVVIDEENAGKLKLSTRAYDNRVAGIVSGANGVNPGIALHQEGVIEGGQNVALSGRVYVQADASNSPIKPGDLLTTSNTPGHAMKVTDHAKAQGAIIGKAMSALQEGKGKVLVLVTLQ